MKIALLGTRGIPNRYGGFEAFFEKLSQYLVKRPVAAFAYAFAGLAGEACLLAAFVHWIYVA